VFDDYLYLSGIQQGRCYETAVNSWRQKRNSANNTIHRNDNNSNDDHNMIPSSRFAYTMGILYWQLNDVWQGPSWSSVEYGGKWKPLQYVIKRSFDSVVLSFSTSGDVVDIYLTNDGPGAVTVRGIELCSLHWLHVEGRDKEDEEVIQDEKERVFVLFELDSVIILAGDSILLKSLPLNDQLLALVGEDNFVLIC
jgi:beta-galactosidase/beta-glucuronidase